MARTLLSAAVGFDFALALKGRALSRPDPSIRYIPTKQARGSCGPAIREPSRVMQFSERQHDLPSDTSAQSSVRQEVKDEYSAVSPCRR